MTDTLTVQEKLALAEKAIDAKLGYDTEVIDIRGKAGFADYFVITSAGNSTQLAAIADNVDDVMAQHGCIRKNPQSVRSSEWILMDYGDIIIHIFDVQARKYYDLERLWKDIRE